MKLIVIVHNLPIQYFNVPDRKFNPFNYTGKLNYTFKLNFICTSFIGLLPIKFLINFEIERNIFLSAMRALHKKNLEDI